MEFVLFDIFYKNNEYQNLVFNTNNALCLGNSLVLLLYCTILQPIWYCYCIACKKLVLLISDVNQRPKTLNTNLMILNFIVLVRIKTLIFGFQAFWKLEKILLFGFSISHEIFKKKSQLLLFCVFHNIHTNLFIQ